MTSSAPAQTAPLPQRNNGNRGRASEENGHNQNAQHNKQHNQPPQQAQPSQPPQVVQTQAQAPQSQQHPNNRPRGNPSHKKGGQWRGEQEGYQRRRDEDRDGTRSPVDSRRRPNRKDYTDSGNGGNAGPSHVNGDANAIANGNSTHSSPYPNGTPRNTQGTEDKQNIVLNELHTKFPRISRNDIIKILNKHHFNKDVCIPELQALALAAEKGEQQEEKGKQSEDKGGYLQVLMGNKKGEGEANGVNEKRKEDDQSQVPHQQSHGTRNNNHYNHPHKSNQSNTNQQTHPNQSHSPNHSHPAQSHPKQSNSNQHPRPNQPQTPEQTHSNPAQSNQLQVVEHANPQDYIASFGRGDEMLSGLSKAIEDQLAEVQRKNQMLTLIKTELDKINNSDKEYRTQLEKEKGQLETDKQAFTEHLRVVDQRLREVDVLLETAKKEKEEKVANLYTDYRSKGYLLTAS